MSRRARETALVVVGFVALSMIAMGASPWSETLAPMDLLLGFRGWDSVPFDEGVHHWQRSDMLDAYLPQWLHIKRSIARGDSVLWNPLAAGGVPGLQNFSSGALSPVVWPFFVIDDPGVGLYVVSLLKLTGCGLGTYLLVRRFVALPSALFGGAVNMLGGFSAAWFPWPQVATSMWVPWLLWAIVAYIEDEEGKWLPAITLFSALMLLGGFPSVAAYGFYCVGLLLVVWWVTARPAIATLLKTATKIFAAVAISFVLCALPLMALLEMLERVNMSSRTGGTSLSLPGDLLTFIAPLHPASRDVERSAYSGIAAVVLAAVAMVRVPEKGRKLFAFAVAALVVATLIAFEILPKRVIVLLPTFKTNAYNRLTSVIGIALALLAAFGFERLLRQQSKRPRLIPVALALCATVQLIDGVWTFRRFNSVTPLSQFYPATPSIDHVANNRAPLQSAAADFSFLFGGTLTAYGVPEWYAHHFRSDAEKKLLSSMVDEPFVSATGAKIDAEEVNLASPLWSAFGIRYLLVAADAELPHLPEHWRRHDLEPTVTVLENLAAPEGAYAIPSLDASPTRLEPAKTTAVTNTEVVVEYRGARPGFVVIPRRAYAGWRGYVDEAHVEVSAYLDVLAAVPVNGPCRVSYRYEPFRHLIGSESR